MICKLFSCNNDTTNPSYCSRSCSTTASNLNSPKRTKKNICRVDTCTTLIPSSRKYCSDHKYGSAKYNTVGELRDGVGYQKNAYLRFMAREWAKKNLDVSVCSHCDYTRHVEIAHIVPVSSFPDSATLEETYVGNVLVLCNRHHWEFDNGYLELRDGLLVDIEPESSVP